MGTECYYINNEESRSEVRENVGRIKFERLRTKKNGERTILNVEVGWKAVCIANG